MTDPRTPLFEAVRPHLPHGYDPHIIAALHAFADVAGIAREATASAFTPRAAAELIHHEAIVLEAYKDSVAVWTWGIGLTKASGVDPLAYKDKPADLATVLRAYVDRVRKVYLPDVLEAFGGCALSEAQLAAALSFHYNTGAIEQTSWVKLFLAGKVAEARTFLETHYLNNGTLRDRRMAEAALFFDGKWEGDGQATIFPVSKPSYQPAFGRGRRVEIMPALREAMA